jgi:arginyl-tRNA synthetase
LTWHSLSEDHRTAIIRALETAARSALSIEPPEIRLDRPPRVSLGDFSSTLAFDLARQLRKSPRAIASELAASIRLPAGVASARVEGGGYLNFFLDRGRFVADFFARRVSSVSAEASEEGKVIVEHTNINPNKAAHIGHLRNAVLGDTLVRCLRYQGRKVEVQNYIDDTGVQVADVVVGFYDLKRCSFADVSRLAQSSTPELEGRAYRSFGDLCWTVYAQVGRAYEEEPEKRGLRAETLHAMELDFGERAEIARAVSRAVVGEHVATMGSLGVAYDLLPRESDILKKEFWSRAFARLRQSGAVTLETEGKHVGCWVMRLSTCADFTGMDEPDKVLVRSNGTVTYTGKDIAYQLWKFGRLDLDFDYAPYSPDWESAGRVLEVPEDVRRHEIWETAPDGRPSDAFGRGSTVYNVIDARQSYPQKVVREGLRALGLEREAESSVHFAYEMVALTPAAALRLGQDPEAFSEEAGSKAYVEMSGRKGLGVKAQDLFEAMREEALREISAREPDLDAAAAAGRARAIVVGALRYFMVKFGRNKVIAFDFQEALNFEGDSGPYLQYSAVRADAIFRKIEAQGRTAEIDAAAGERLGALEWEDDLWEIFSEAARVSEIVRRAIDGLELAQVARQAFALAQLFSHFYHRHPVLNEPDETLREKRLAVVRAFRESLGLLLDLLGIPAPQKM